MVNESHHISFYQQLHVPLGLQKKRSALGLPIHTCKLLSCFKEGKKNNKVTWKALMGSPVQSGAIWAEVETAETQAGSQHGGEGQPVPAEETGLSSQTALQL